jgi:hypothetical protein
MLPTLNIAIATLRAALARDPDSAVLGTLALAGAHVHALSPAPGAAPAGSGALPAAAVAVGELALAPSVLVSQARMLVSQVRMRALVCAPDEPAPRSRRPSSRRSYACAHLPQQFAESARSLPTLSARRRPDSE